MSSSSSPANASRLGALTLAAIGVVYGDIGTSPLYALKEMFHGGRVPVTEVNILGVLSLIFWTITIVVSLKYVLLILRADNNGEGGLIALLALASTAVKDNPSLRRKLMLVGAFGTAVFYGDAVITPAVTVVGAIEGLEVISPNFHSLVIPCSILVITGLFAAQRFGTAVVGKVFGPLSVVWFVVLIALGLPHIFQRPEVLAAMNPMHAIGFFQSHGGVAFFILGAVVLVVTGGEALYADLGHFGKLPIRLAWYGLVMPALLVNYFGQGAMLMGQPDAIRNPFYLMAPGWATTPLLILATCAAAVASQAMISAAFSVTKQAIPMGLLPRLRIKHTSGRDTGQIYVPFINWGMYALVVLAVVLFGSSSKLTSAYGIAVTLDMTITTLMTFYVIRYGWKYPLALCVGATGIFFMIDIAFLTSNLFKLADGGWFPLAIGGTMFVAMMTWKRGREVLSERLRSEAIGLQSFLDAVFMTPPTRVPGTAVFMVSEPNLAPNALMHNLKHNKVLHETNLFVHVRHHEVPWIGFGKRMEMSSLGRDCWQITLNFGFKNEPNVPESLKSLGVKDLVRLDDMETSYFLSRDSVIPAYEGGLPMWQKKFFANMHYLALGAADYLGLPSNRVVELGSKVEI